jgi:hypothetical protein
LGKWRVNKMGMFKMKSWMMKRLLLAVALVALSLGLVPVNAGAVPISGAISFAGNVILDNTDLNLATKFTAFNATVVTAVGGDYSGIAIPTPATFKLFTFRPPAASVVPLWTLIFGPKTYSLDATKVVVSYSSTGDLVLNGLGLAHLTGLDDTIGSWSVTANNAGQTFSFYSSTAVPAVPEPATMFLLGTGLVGLGYGVRRRFKK